MSIIAAKSGENIFHYNMIGTGIITSHNANSGLLVLSRETTGEVLSVVSVGAFSFEKFIDNCKRSFEKAVMLSN